MSVSPIASVMARISSIESRFAANQAPAAAVPSTASGASSVAPDFGQVFGSVLNTGTLGATAVPWTQLTGVASTIGTAQLSRLPFGDVDPVTPVNTGAQGTPAPNTLDTLDDRPVVVGTPFADLFDAAGARHGVPPRLLASIGYVESRYQTDVVSAAGAEGVMQLMPFVSEHYGVDARNPAEAIDAAAQLLAEHHERFGSWDLAVASYFSGAGAVSRAGNTPPTTRSHDYVRNVTERLPAT